MIQNKHTDADLRQLQSLPLPQKELMSKNLIRQWYEYWDGNVYVSVSGGKDSEVLADLALSVFDDIPRVFFDTGLEYPEVRKFAMEHSDVVVKPKKTFKQVIDEYGYPVVSKEVAQIVREARIGIARGDGSYEYRIKKLRGELLDKNGNKSKFNQKKWGFLLDAPFAISEQRCSVMKKAPAKEYERETGRKPIIGAMAEESNLRRQRWIRHGCNAFTETKPSSNPLSFWTEQDILRYIVEHKLPYASVYGDIVEDENGLLKTTGVSRTGCMFCMFGCHLEKEPNRFQRMKETHPKQWEYCMDKLGLRDVLAYINVPCE